MARSTAPVWPSRCDSLRGFHILRAAALRSGSDADSRSLWARRLAVGPPRDCGDASRAVPRIALRPSPFSSARDLDRPWLCRLAMGDGARICRCWCTRRLAVLRRTCDELASVVSSEIGSARVAVKLGWFSGYFLRYVSSARYRVLPARPGDRCTGDARSVDVLIFLSDYFCRPDRSISAFSTRLEKKTNTR